MHMDSTRMHKDSLHAAAANLPPSASAYTDSELSFRVATAPANQIQRRYWHSDSSLISSDLMDRSSDSQLMGLLITSWRPSIYADESMIDFNGWTQHQQENQAIVPPNASLPAYQSQLDANPVNSTTCRYEPPDDLGRPFEDSDDKPLSRDKRPKRQAANAPMNNGNKSCTCKRSQCLKLYCECFSNKYFCSEACTCEGCYNTQEYEDLVQKSNKQIESRDQHAFSAQVTNGITSIFRHRKGCNCKKSLCQKKYCECYRAGVGCSLNCHCETCMNSYGTRNEYNKIAEMVNVRIRGEDDSTDGRREGVVADVNCQENDTHLSSLTASLPNPMENEALRSQNTGSYDQLSNSIPETIMRQSLQKEFIQDGIESHFTHNSPYDNLAQHFDENMSVLESLIASCAGSAESDARNPQSRQSDLTQVGEHLSDHTNEDFMQ